LESDARTFPANGTEDRDSFFERGIGIGPPGKEDVPKAMEGPIGESTARIEFRESHQKRSGAEQKDWVPGHGLEGPKKVRLRAAGRAPPRLFLLVAKDDGDPFLRITLEHLLEGGSQRVGCGLREPREFGFQAGKNAYIFPESRQRGDDAVHILLWGAIGNSKSCGFVKTGDQQQRPCQAAPEPFGMLKISTAHTNEGSCVIGFVEGAVAFGEDFAAGLAQALLRSAIDERAKQGKCIPGRTKGPNRGFEVERRIAHRGEPARVAIDVVVGRVAQFRDHGAVVFIRCVPSTRKDHRNQLRIAIPLRTRKDSARLYSREYS